MNDESEKNIIGLTFPCQFTVKVIGAADQSFKLTVLNIMQQHIHQLSEDAVQSRLSENGKYCALSITISVDSKQQLDRIYHDLSSCPQVLMAL